MINDRTQTMKYIMENFKRYQTLLESDFGESDNTIYLFENNQKVPTISTFDMLLEQRAKGIISEQELVNIWEQSFDYEAKEIERLCLLNEQGPGMQPSPPRVRPFTKRDPVERTPPGQEEEQPEATVDAPGWLRKLGQFFNKIIQQALRLLKTVKNALSGVVSVIKKVLQVVGRFCTKYPTFCKVIKILMLMLAVVAVVSVVNSAIESSTPAEPTAPGAEPAAPGAEPAAQATAAAAAVEEQSIVITGKGMEALKGIIADGAQSEAAQDPAVAQEFTNAYQWLQRMHAADGAPDISQAAEEGNQLVLDYYDKLKQLVEMAREAETSDEPLRGVDRVLSHFADIGEDVVVSSNSVYSSISRNMETTVNDIRWQSLEVR